MDKDKAFVRFKQAIEYLKDNGQARIQENMAALMGVRQPHLASAIKGDHKRLTEGLLKKFAAAYSDYINEEWLLTGEGSMEVPDKSLRPHYDAKASAGFMDGVSEGKMSAEFRAMAIPLLGYDFSIDAKGDSMMPRIEDGDTLLCRVANDRLNPPIGKICVIDTKDGVVVKEIKSANQESLTLHSLNPAYRDYDIDLDIILGIAEVVGLVRSFV